MKTLSVRQPWAWLIVHGFKPIENRTWNTKVRGSIMIHAGKSFDKEGYDWVRENFPQIEMPQPAQFERGGIVGLADLYSAVTASDSPWFFGPVGFSLREAKPLPFVPMLGRLGFFEVETPPDLGHPIPSITEAQSVNRPGGTGVEQHLNERSHP